MTTYKTNAELIDLLLNQKDLFKEELFLNNIIWSSLPKNKNFEAFVKIRYNMSAIRADITIQEDDSVNIKFKEPISAVTPGQACVFYDLKEGYLLGGGFISL